MSLSIFVKYEGDGSPSCSGVKSPKTINLMVSRLQNGADLCKEVYKKSKGELKNSIEDYQLYWPEKKLWIQPRNQVGLLHLEAGAKLEYRPRKRHIRLRFLDASSKLLLVDETKPVKELVEDICAQLRVESPQELSLVVAGDYEVQKRHYAKNKSKSMTRVGSGSPIEARKMITKKEKSAIGLSVLKQTGDSSPRPPLSPSIRRKRPGSASGSKNASGSKKYPVWNTSKVKKQISKKHQIRLDTPWLDPTKTLAEQEVTDSDELILMYRFYYQMDLKRNSANVELLYKQSRATYLAGELLCSPNDMIRLSAILCQITKGNYSKHKYSPDFISTIKGVIAPPKCKIKAVAKQIIAEHSSLEDVTVADAKCWFIKLWSSLELFGMEFLSCTNMDTKDKGLIGVSKDRVMFLYHKQHKKNIFWDMDKLLQWTHDTVKDLVSLTFSHSISIEVLNLILPDYSGVLIDCLQGHREVSDTVPDVMRACNEYQFDDEMESAIRVFATLTKRDAKERRGLNSLTYEDVYWASKIENPMMSAEELSQIKKDSWENPVFSDMDQLMTERFDFLDFSEYTEPSNDSDITPVADSSPHLSPHHSRPHLNGSSPLIMSRKSESAGSESTAISPREMLHNGIMESLFKNSDHHSRNSSSESGSSKSGCGPISEDDEMRGERKLSNSGLPELVVK